MSGIVRRTLHINISKHQIVLRMTLLSRHSDGDGSDESFCLHFTIE